MANCVICGAKCPPHTGSPPKTCSDECRRARQQEIYRSRNPQRLGLPAGTVGALSELLVSADLIRRGFDVFRALSPHSGCDLIAIHTSDRGNGHAVQRVEVKTGSYKNTGEPTYPKPRKDEDYDILAIVLPDNRIEYKPPFTV